NILSNSLYVISVCFFMCIAGFTSGPGLAIRSSCGRRWTGVGSRPLPHRHLRMALPALARGLLPARAGPTPRAWIRLDLVGVGRDQRLLLLAAATKQLRAVARADAGRLRLLSQRPTLHHAHEEARRRRGAAGQLLRFGSAGPRRPAGAGAVAAAADAGLRRRPPCRVLRAPATDHTGRRVAGGPPR